MQPVRRDCVADLRNRHRQFARAKNEKRLDTQGAARACSYLSTLQPHVGHVHPPHIPSAIDVGLRSADMGVRQRGQLVVSDPMPQRPFFFDWRMKKKPMTTAAMAKCYESEPFHRLPRPGS